MMIWLGSGTAPEPDAGTGFATAISGRRRAAILEYMVLWLRVIPWGG